MYIWSRQAHPLHRVAMATDYRTTGCGANLVFVSLPHVALLEFYTMHQVMQRLKETIFSELSS